MPSRGRRRLLLLRLGRQTFGFLAAEEQARIWSTGCIRKESVEQRFWHAILTSSIWILLNAIKNSLSDGMSRGAWDAEATLKRELLLQRKHCSRFVRCFRVLTWSLYVQEGEAVLVPVLRPS